MSKTRHGRCGCGDVSFTTPDDPVIVHCCHCSYCQRETGSAFVVNFLIESDRVEWNGETEEILTPSESGGGQRIHRCPTCHVALASHYPVLGDAFFMLRAGTFDDKTGIKPDVHIYTSTKQEWVDLGDIPAFEGLYDHLEFWSPETLARVRKALGR
ncbi:GFA family protein [Sphingomicrobium nitratireducens]|uniref:GFA family protein n=1 Tax=Sphingomicrobium nitratireducens TaxID=2964666 RepID=UPI00223FD640|nr:GFA family protein [Sphingomicrobium nitratireducens]